MGSGEVKVTECEGVRRRLLERGELTAAEAAHAKRCAVCADAVMETEIEAVLERKPEVAVPADFAARVSVQARGEKRGARRWAQQKVAHGRWRHGGRNIAVVVLLAVPVVVTMHDPQWWTATGTLQRMLLPALAGEVAGIALWLGLRREI